MTTFSLLSKPMLTPELFEASRSVFAYSLQNNALPTWLSDAFLNRISDNEKAIHDQAMVNDDEVIVTLRPSAVMTNVMGYDVCRPTWRELGRNFFLVFLSVSMFLAFGVACYFTCFLVVSDEGLFSKTLAVVGLPFALIAVLKVFFDTHDVVVSIVRLTRGKGSVDSEEYFLMIANQVSAITKKGLINSSEIGAFVPTLITWSEVGAVKQEGSSIFILDHQGDEITYLYHPATETMASSDVLDLIRENIAVQ